MLIPTTGNTKSSTPQTILPTPTAGVIPMSTHPPPIAVVPDPQPNKLTRIRSPQTTQLPQNKHNHLMMQMSASQLSPPSLPDTWHLVLFKCLGQPPDSILNQPNITVSSQLQDLYRQPHSASPEPLSPESACLLTICYFNSLRSGEAIDAESLRTMLQYAQQGEADWIQYHKKHKKMSESTYVQSQLFHLSRVAVYPLHSRVQVMVSHHSLGEGLMNSLYHLQYIASGSQSLPECVVVMSVHPSAPSVEFCVLMIEPLQVLRVREAELLELNRKKQNIKGRLTSPAKPTQLSLSSEVISSIQQFEKSLKGTVQLPFYCPLSEGQGSNRLSAVKAESMVPASSHIIEHKPTGPFQEQCDMAAILRQKILSCFNSEKKFEHFKNIDFRVLCPPDACFVSQTVSEIINSGLIEYSLCDPPSKTSGSPSSKKSTDLDFEAEARRRVVCCNLISDVPRFQALLNDLQTNKDTLYLIIIENAHLTSRLATKSFLSANGKSVSGSEHVFVPTSDCLSLLCNVNNCVFLNVSSHPYSLQTSLSFFSPVDNQIHWPPAQQLTREERQGGQFCSMNSFRGHVSAEEKQSEFGVSFREDQCFEELFHKTAAKLNQR